MDYFYPERGTLWCWNWYHIVCLKWKWEVTHPYQSRVINLCKKQKWCSLWFSRSHVQQDIIDVHLYLRDFMSNLQRSKRFDLIDKFNDSSRYLDDISTIDNQHIPDIYPREVQLNKANTSDKETSFLDLNTKGIGNNIHTSFYDTHADFGFPIDNFPWLSGDVPRLPSYGMYISQLVRFARCCTRVFDFHSKIFKSLQNY